MARLDHWIKNIFILPGIYWSLIDGQNFNLGMVITAIISICISSSANYTINEWFDRKTDLHHVTKKKRVAVQNKVKAKYVYLQYFILVISSLILSASVSLNIVLLTLVFLGMGVLYNVPPLRLKDIAIMDVLSESVNNPIRFLFGWYILSEGNFTNTQFLIGYWSLGAFLMNNKRLSEFIFLGDSKETYLYRPSFRFYSEIKLKVFSMIYLGFSIFVVNIKEILFPFIFYLFMILLLFFLIQYYKLSLSLIDNSHYLEPEKLYRDKIIRLISTLFIILFVGNYYLF
jgi:4-hydroxybenzoate polyprenyltransferase